MGLILDSSLFISDERKTFDLVSWLRSRPPEAVAASVVTFSELWFGIEVEEDAGRARRRRRWLENTFRRLELIPMDAGIARLHARIWAQLSRAGKLIGPYDLIIAATALRRRWSIATFNVTEFRQVRGLTVIEP